MAIKSIAQDNFNGADNYPKLMISKKGRIVLFTRRKVGMLVYFDSDQGSVGSYSTAWDMEEFRDYHGDVILTNE